MFKCLSGLMKGTLPKSQLIIGYKKFFGYDPPEDRLSLLNGASKDHLIMEIASLNFQIKPNRTLYQDTTLETQTKILKHFFLYDEVLLKKYAINYGRFIKSKHEFGLLITRSSCLFAMEEIVQSSLPIIDEFNMSTGWEKLFAYLLAVNSEITKYKETSESLESDGGSVIPNDSDDIPLEIVNAKLLALNELALSIDPIYTPYRGYHLCKYFIEETELAMDLMDYFKSVFNVEWEQYFYEILGLYIANNVHGESNIIHPITGVVIDTSFHYTINKKDEFFFSAFAKVFPNSKIHTLISIKKYPLFHYFDDKYILFDNQLIIDKSYNQLINDFWFDIVKQLKDNKGLFLYTIDSYRSVIGMFFESYLKILFIDLLGNMKHKVLKQFEELKVRRNKDEIELADIYFRSGKRVFLAQAKTTSIYDNEKYSGELNILYKNSRDEFFTSFGLNQLVSSIENLESLVLQIDDKFPANRTYRIYPAILVNENVMQTPLMSEIFRKRFSELTTHLKSNKVTIFPLTLIHVSDIENMLDNVRGRDDLFFELLDKARANKAFAPPFYKVLQWEDIYPRHKKTRELFNYLIEKYKVAKQ